MKLYSRMIDFCSDHITYLLSVLFLCVPFLSSAQQSLTVSGIVRDKETREPLSGVYVLEKGTKNTTFTDLNGVYELTVENQSDSLVFTSYGYKTSAVALNGSSEIDVDLSSAYVYNETKRQYLARQKMAPEIDKTNFNAASPANAVEGVSGRSSALSVLNFSGEPGYNPFLSIRGLNSFIFSHRPLVLLDGTPVDELADINFDDIEDIRIIEDVSSLAILGGQGANGALLISTKRGETGKNRVNFNVSYGVQTFDKRLSMLTPQQQLDYMRDLNTPLLGTPQDITPHLGNSFISDSLIDVNNLKNNDWQDRLFSMGNMQNYGLSFTGGSENTRFRVSTSYYVNNGIIEPSDFSRLNVSFNLDQKVSKRVDIGSSVYLTRSQQNVVNTQGSAEEGNVVLSALAYPSFLPEFAANGSYFINPLKPGINNVGANNHGVKDLYSRNSIVANFFMNYQVMKNLMLQVNTSGNLALLRRSSFTSTSLTYLGRQTDGLGIFSGHELTSWNLEAMANYTLSDGINDLDAVGGVIYYKGRNAWDRATGTGYPNDLVELLSGAGTTTSVSNTNDYDRLAYLARIKYGLSDKYFLLGNIRAENSSRFDNRNKTGIFYGANASWMISNEDFLSGNSQISHLEINAGYGVTGNDGGDRIGLLYPQFYGDTIPPLNPDEEYPDNEYPGAGFHTRNIQDQGWEMTSEISAGLDLGIFDNRLFLSASWFSRDITDLILPDLTSPDIIYVNGGEMTSTGYQADLRGNILTGGNLKWTSGLHLLSYTNEVKSTGNLSEGMTVGYLASSNIIKEGHPLYAIWGYETDGIFQNQSEVDAHAAQFDAGPGDIRYVNQNGDAVIDENDKVMIGDPNPDLFIGFDNTFRYRGLELNVLLQGAAGADKLNLVKMQTQGCNDFINQADAVANRWTSGSNENKIPRAYPGINNVQISDRFVEKAGYLRIKQLTLGYYLPSSFTKKAGISRTYIYATAYNLFTFTGYSGYDPETSSYSILGVDYGAYPNARYMGIGLKLGF